MITSEEQGREFVAERCDPTAMDRLEVLIASLKEENQRQNLVSAKSLDHVWQRHIADSAQLVDYVPRETGPWLDLGSGAGFPGLVIAAMWPEVPLILVESRKRRIEWLEAMVAKLALSNCQIAGMRLESVDTQPVRVITARAFAPLEKLLSLSARFSTGDSVWLLPKGRSAKVELQGIEKKWRRLFHVEQSATDPEAAILVGSGAVRAKKGKA